MSSRRVVASVRTWVLARSGTGFFATLRQIDDDPVLFCGCDGDAPCLSS